MIRLPDDYINRIRIQLGDEAEDFIASYEAGYIKSLRINARKNKGIVLPYDLNVYNIEDVCENNICKQESRVLWESNGFYYKEIENNDEYSENILCLKAPGKSSLHAAGAYYIQEASAMLPVTKLKIDSEDDQRHLKVLDLCAAPGGKSTQIADYLNGRGLLVSNEITSSRAKILSENIERMGVANAVVISEDPIKLAPRFSRYFDRILVDAPCSGEGMFRKHPEAIDEWSIYNVMMCAKRQSYILDCAAQMLDFGGRIVYSTCTFSPEEDEKNIDAFLERHPEFVRALEDEHLYPHLDKGEGHFVAVLEYRDINEINENKRRKISPTLNRADKSVMSALIEFIKCNMVSCKILGIQDTEVLNKRLPEAIEERLIMFGDNLYLCPEYMPDITALTVLRPGLHIGIFTKGRFEPAHAFAMSLCKEEMKFVVDYMHDSREIDCYLRGLTNNYDGPNGWYLVCTQGVSVGWAKNANNVLKNHYPKGLRIMG